MSVQCTQVSKFDNSVSCKQSKFQQKIHSKWKIWTLNFEQKVINRCRKFSGKFKTAYSNCLFEHAIKCPFFRPIKIFQNVNKVSVYVSANWISTKHSPTQVWGLQFSQKCQMRHLVEELITFSSIFGPQKFWMISLFPKPKQSFGNELVPNWNQCPYSARFRQETHPQAAFGIDYHCCDLNAHISNGYEIWC